MEELPQQNLPHGVQLQRRQVSSHSDVVTHNTAATTAAASDNSTNHHPSAGWLFLTGQPCGVRDATLSLRQGSGDGADVPSTICTWPQLVSVLTDKNGRTSINGKVHVLVVNDGVRLADPGEWLLIERITSDEQALVLVKGQERCKCAPVSILKELAMTPEDIVLPTPEN